MIKHKNSFRMTAAAMAAGILFLTSCNGHAGSEKQLKECADSFATAYYDWHFSKALPYVTAGSQKWLRFAASQVHQKDVDILRGMESGAAHELGDITYTGDSTADVELNVSNYLGMDTLGRVGHIVKNGRFTIKMRYDGGRWLVRMEGLPRNETPDRGRSQDE